MSLATPIAAEDRGLPQLRRDTAAMPGWALAGAGILVVAAAVLAVAGPEGGPWWWHTGWLLAAAALIVVGWPSARRATMQTNGEPWAHGPAGRLAASGVFTYHLVALLLWQLPKWPALPYRDPVRALISPWMDLCATRQAWSMFAPNPPRHNTTLRTRIIDAADVEHDLRTELQHHLVRPSLRHDRSRKIDEAISLSRPELAPWHARWLCRRWELERHEPAREVILERVSAAIDPLAPGPVDFWARAVVQPITRITCATEPFAQLDDELRARHGLPPALPGRLHYTWPKGQDAPAPQWLLLALGLAVGLGVWAREDRRRHVAGAAALRGPAARPR